jgi:predicted RecB family endonuclease
LSAEIVWLCDRLAESKDDLAIDLRTAVDVAIRDLQEIENNWGTERARERLTECQEMLRTVLAAC